MQKQESIICFLNIHTIFYSWEIICFGFVPFHLINISRGAFMFSAFFFICLHGSVNVRQQTLLLEIFIGGCKTAHRMCADEMGFARFTFEVPWSKLHQVPPASESWIYLHPNVFKACSQVFFPIGTVCIKLICIINDVKQF